MYTKSEGVAEKSTLARAVMSSWEVHCSVLMSALCSLMATSCCLSGFGMMMLLPHTPCANRALGKIVGMLNQSASKVEEEKLLDSEKAFGFQYHGVYSGQGYALPLR